VAPLPPVEPLAGLVAVGDAQAARAAQRRAEPVARVAGPRPARVAAQQKGAPPAAQLAAALEQARRQHRVHDAAGRLEALAAAQDKLERREGLFLARARARVRPPLPFNFPFPLAALVKRAERRLGVVRDLQDGVVVGQVLILAEAPEPVAQRLGALVRREPERYGQARRARAGPSPRGLSYGDDVSCPQQQQLTR
jgi:hypothetical protein